jgi:hypothetical protein
MPKDYMKDTSSAFYVSIHTTMPPLSTTLLAARRASRVLPVPYYPVIVVIFPTGYPPP